MHSHFVKFFGALCALAVSADRSEATVQRVEFGGAEITASTPCMTAEQTLFVRRVMADHWAQDLVDSPLPAGALGASSTPPKFEFYPLGGNLYGDLFTNNFNDLDPTSGILDWDCSNHTYNGHDATDVVIRGFAEQAVGVPIYAALDGTVIGASDGQPDMNTDCLNPAANYVILAHAGGRNTYYWHMKTGSVAVTMGQSVQAGEQIGLVGSSGCSTDPHLHFATYDNNGSTLVEPYTGPCNPGVSEWENQTPIPRDLYFGDMNFTDVDIAALPGLPFEIPRTGTLVTGLRTARFWIQLYNLPPGSNWRVRYRRPNGSIAFDSGFQNFNNPNTYRSSWWWWSYNINFDQVGTWQAEVEINGATAESIPVEIVASAAGIQNRAPYEVEASFDPPVVTLDDVLFCRIESDLVHDDPDYDVVRYEYTWRVNGTIVRQLTSAGRADALSHHVATAPGDEITCTIVPSDGFLTATPTVLSLRVSPDQFEEFCFGEGETSPGCTPCPCGNDAPLGSGGGCLNSVAESSRMLVVGAASASLDTLRIEMRGGPASTFAILISGASRAPGNAANPCFGLDTGLPFSGFDGLRCAVQGVLRHGTRPTDLAGSVGETNNGWGPPSGPALGLLASAGFVVGQTRHFQIVHRDDVSASCMRGQNTTQGGTVTIAP